MNKPTILDILTTLEVTPDILNRRADYWDNVAVRHDRHNRDAQAERLRFNIAAMRTEARRLARLAKSEKFSSDPSKGKLARALVSRANKPAKLVLVPQSNATRAHASTAFDAKPAPVAKKGHATFAALLAHRARRA
jgi:hypothetical protein